MFQLVAHIRAKVRRHPGGAGPCNAIRHAVRHSYQAIHVHRQGSQEPILGHPGHGDDPRAGLLGPTRADEWVSEYVV